MTLSTESKHKQKCKNHQNNYQQIDLQFGIYHVEQASTVAYKNRQYDAKAVSPLLFVYYSRVSNVAPQSGFPRWLFGSS